MDSLTEDGTTGVLSRQFVKVLRELLLPVRKRLSNHEEHIKYLLARDKELKREREADKAEIKRLSQVLQKEDAE
jgi:hypothetical protein